MKIQDRKLLAQIYGLNHKEQSKVFSMIRSGKFTIDSAAKFILKERTK